MDANNHYATNLFDQARKKEMGTAFITTSSLTAPFSASFLTHRINKSTDEDIAEEIVLKHIPDNSYPEQWDIDGIEKELQRIYALKMAWILMNTGKLIPTPSFITLSAKIFCTSTLCFGQQRLSILATASRPKSLRTAF